MSVKNQPNSDARIAAGFSMVAAAVRTRMLEYIKSKLSKLRQSISTGQEEPTTSDIQSGVPSQPGPSSRCLRQIPWKVVGKHFKEGYN